MFGFDFIQERNPLDLKCLEELQGKMNTAELADLRAVLSEFNESLMVDQITQNENVIGNNHTRSDQDADREKVLLGNNVKNKNNECNLQKDVNSESDDINR